jgi:gliding motility-associated-like protein
MKNRNNPLSLFCLLVIGLSFLQQSASAQLQAKFSASAPGGCAPLVVQFQDQSSGNPNSWQWDLGNGTISLFQHPSTVYFLPGTYPVKLVIRNAAGADSIIQQQFITVYTNPTASFLASDSIGCFPLKVQFTDKSIAPGANIRSWHWDFGDGHTSTQASPQHTYLNAGNHTVTLKITTDKGCTHSFSKEQFIRISSGVKSAFSDASDMNCKAPLTMQFQNVSTGPGTLSYSWDFGDGNNSTAQNPVHTYTRNGSFTVSLVTVSNAGCRDTLKKTNLVKLGVNITQFRIPDSICTNQPIDFINTSSPVPSSVRWSFGDGSSSTVLNPSKSYATAGTYDIKLVNTFEKCVDSITKPVKVFTRPKADFTSDVQTFCSVPAAVRFSGSNNAIAWRWEFGDGATANTREATHTYTSFGNYTVKLFITGAGGCIDSAVKSEYINIARPKVTITGLPAGGCLPLTVSPSITTEPGETIVSYHWDFGDGTTSTSATPVKQYAVEGKYTVKLFFVTAGGCKDSMILRDAVQTNVKPNADFSATPREGCAETNIVFTNLSTPKGTKWQWNFGDGGTSITEKPGYSYHDTGYFNVQLIVTNNTCADTIVKERYMYIKPPTAHFVSKMSCNDKFLRSFVNGSKGAARWLWNFGDGTTSTEWEPQHRYTATGTYQVSLTSWNGDCMEYNPQTIRIIDEHPGFNNSADETCKGGNVIFTPFNYNASNISSMSWKFGDGKTKNALGAVVHAYSKPGIYRVVMYFTDYNGCADSVVKQQAVRVHGPTAAFTVQQQTICKGATALFEDKSTTDGIHPITRYSWNYGDGTSSNNASSPFTHSYTDTGSYTVTLKVLDSYGCVDSVVKPAGIIISKPTPVFSSPDTSSCPGKPINFNNSSGGSGLTFRWNFGDGTSSTQLKPVHTYAMPGLYTVTLYVTDKFGCTDSLIRPGYIRISIPVASFIASDSISTCPPLQVQFTSHAQNYATLKWDFGDGTGSVLQNPEHFYNRPGTYYVKQIIIGPGGCTDTAVKKMVVKGPQGFFTYAPLQGCKPLTVSMKASTSQNVSFVWDFNDGVTLPTKDSEVTHTYTNAGNFIPKLILIDSTGCRVPVTGKDTLKVVGVTARASMDEYRVCNEGFIQFTDRSVANDYITGHHWDFGDGSTSTQANPRHFYKQQGTYSIKHIAITSLGCRDTTMLNDTVKVWPKPDVTILGENAACEPAKLKFSPRVLTGDSAQFKWQWNFGNGNIIDKAQADSQQYQSAGNYTVQLQVSFNNFCRDTATHPVSIMPLPKTFAGNDTFVCYGKPVLLRPGGADKYVWTAAPGLSCTDCATPLINPDDNISYVVTGFTTFGCSTKDSINVRVRHPFRITAAPGDTLCKGESLAMKATGAELYQWFPAEGLNNQYIATPKATPSTTTIYTVVGSDSDHCFTDSAKVPVKVYPIPDVFAGNDTTVNTGATLPLRSVSSPDVNKWKWFPANGLSCVDCAAPNAAIKNTITYRVDVSNEGGCKSYDDITIHAVCNGGNYFLPNTFSPNGDGANDVFYVRGKGVNRIQSLKIFNRWGQLVFEKRDITPNDPGSGWDGTYNGKRADMDVYIYIAEVICENSQIVALKGDVTLIR